MLRVLFEPIFKQGNTGMACSAAAPLQAALKYSFGEKEGALATRWRLLFVAVELPSLLLLVVAFYLKAKAVRVQPYSSCPIWEPLFYR